MLQYILGIDGGGTSTIAVIASTSGEIVAYSKSGPSNPNTTERHFLLDTFEQIFLGLKTQTDSQVWSNIIHVFAGISGAEHQRMKQIIYDVLAETYDGQAKVTVDNDAITALYASTGGKYGIVQISGTGSITFGVNSNNQRSRVGGWGHLINENSSGYYIGKSALAAAFDAFDSVGGQTLLVDKFIRHFRVEKLPDIVDAIYHATNPKQQIADLAKIVFEVAEEGDSISASILRRTGQNIGESVVVLANKLLSTAERNAGVEVILVGSIFKQIEPLMRGLIDVQTKVSYPISFKRADCEPVIGAIICGMKQENKEISEIFMDTIKKSNKGRLI